MVDGLYRLRHDAVVGRHYYDSHVGDRSASCTHGGERLVTGGVEEGDLSAVVHRDAVGAYVLGYTAGFALYHVTFSYEVEQRGLTVVHMAHHGDDGWTRYEVCGVVFALGYLLLYLHRHEFDFEAELLSHYNDGLGIKTLVDRHHQP